MNIVVMPRWLRLRRASIALSNALSAEERGDLVLARMYWEAHDRLAHRWIPVAGGQL